MSRVLCTLSALAASIRLSLGCYGTGCPWVSLRHGDRIRNPPGLLPGKAFFGCQVERGSAGFHKLSHVKRFTPHWGLGWGAVPRMLWGLACHNPRVIDVKAPPRPYAYAITLIVLGVAGVIAAFALTVDKFALLENPQITLNCDISVLVACGPNLNSAQGSLFGFPNPILGLVGWMAPIVVGAALLAGARFERWFRILFNIGVAGAMALVIFLIITSIFFLGTLCLWCMLTWVATIPVFWLVTLNNLRDGTIRVPRRSLAFFEGAYSWVPAISLISLVIVATLAQVQLDAINRL